MATKGTSAAVYQEAKKWLGAKGDAFWRYFGSGKVDWCCMAVTYWYHKAAKKLLPIKTAWVPTLQEYCAKTMKHVKMADAKPGDIVIFTWNGKGYNTAPKGQPRNHVGLIRKQSNSSKKVYTIEGNVDSASAASSHVANKTRAACYIYAIYRPKNQPKPKTTEPKKTTTTTKKTTTTSKKDTGPKKIDINYKVIEKAGMMVRKGPGTNFKAIGTVGVGKTFRCTQKDGDWVYAPILKGWVCVKKGKTTYLKVTK